MGACGGRDGTITRPGSAINGWLSNVLAPSLAVQSIRLKLDLALKTCWRAFYALLSAVVVPCLAVAGVAAVCVDAVNDVHHALP